MNPKRLERSLIPEGGRAIRVDVFIIAIRANTGFPTVSATAALHGKLDPFLPEPGHELGKAAIARCVVAPRRAANRTSRGCYGPNVALIVQMCKPPLKIRA